MPHREHLAYENDEMMHSYTTDHYSKDISARNKQNKCVDLLHQYSHWKRKKIIKCSSTKTVVLLDDLGKQLSYFNLYSNESHLSKPLKSNNFLEEEYLRVGWVSIPFEHIAKNGYSQTFPFYR